MRTPVSGATSFAILMALLLLNAVTGGAQTSCPQTIGSDVDRDGVDDFCDSSYDAPVSPPVPNASYADNRVLIAHFKFPEASPPFDVEQIRERFVGPHPFTLAQFFAEISFGATRQTYDIKPWADLPHSRAYYQASDPYGYQLEADALSYVGRHYSLTDIDIVLLIVTPLDLGYPGVHAYLPPGITIGDSELTLPVALVSGNGFGNFNTWGMVGYSAHELGHTFGFLHTSTLECQSWPAIVPASLTDPRHSETDCWPGSPDALLIANNHYDFMGGYEGHPNSFQKWQAGWLKPTQVVDVPSGGTFVIESYEVAGDGPKALRVPLGTDADGEPVAYWIEYRTKPIVRLDTRSTAATTDRVFVWVNLPNVANSNSSSSFEFSVISLTLPTRDTHLAVGDVFADPYRGLRITRSSDSVAQGLRRTSITVERSALKFEPSLGTTLGPNQVRHILVTNSGAASISLGHVDINGRNPAAFRKVFDSCSGAVLSQLATCRVAVAYSSLRADDQPEYAHLQWATSEQIAPSPTVGLIGGPTYSPSKRRVVRH